MKNILLCTVVIFLLCSACTDSFLDHKPNRSMVVPSSVEDFQALLDQTDVMNAATAGIQTISTDNFVLTDDSYLLNAYVASERNAYVWSADIYEGGTSTDWNRAYLTIFYANIVLEGVNKLENSMESTFILENMRGSALFFRAYSYYHLVQVFSPCFDFEAETEQLGVPIRISSNVNRLVERPSLKQNYDHIIEDLKEAIELLPLNSAYKTRPTKAAAYALLARTYLSMRNYEMALQFANEALRLHPYLIDYNNLDVSSLSPFPLAVPNGNDEVIFYASTGSFGFFYNASTGVDVELFNSFESDDLRKEAFFTLQEDGTIRFKGNYSGTTVLFGGLASDEMYLIQAECLARLGNIDGAIESMEGLLSTRFRRDSYRKITIADPLDLLEFILQERRKQLLGRGIRWTDLRRLNMEQRFQKTIIRSFQGAEYTLLPNDVRYVFPIPNDEIAASGITQNDR